MERQKIKSEKFSNQCRICLSSNFELKSIFELYVDKMIMACASVLVQMNDGLPQLICVQCINQANSAYSFKKLCEKNDIALRQAVVKLEAEAALRQAVAKLEAAAALRQAVVKIEAENVLRQAVVKIEPEGQPSHYNDAEVMKENKMLLYSAGEDQGNARCPDAQTIVEQPSIINVKNEYTAGKPISTYKWVKNEYAAGKAISNYKWCRPQLNVDAKTHIKESDKQDENIHICCICKEEFMDLKKLKRHIILVHTRTKKCRVCKTCLRDFPNKKTRRAHSRIHYVKERTIDKPQDYKIGGYSYLNSAGPSNYMRSHKIKKPLLYLCLTCGKPLENAEDLPIHMRKHPGEQRCVCSLCGKEVSNLNELILHTHFHTRKTFYAENYNT